MTFTIVGLIGVFLPAAAAATAGLSGVQVLWIIAAAIILRIRTVPASSSLTSQVAATR